MLRTPNLRSWIAADATHLHHDLKRRQTRFAEVQVILTCRGVSEGAQPSCFFPVGGSTANGREAKLRDPTGTAHDLGNSAVALELDESSSRH